MVPSDSNGLRCGVDSEVLDKPYLVFFDLSKCADPRVPLTGCNTPQVSCLNLFFIAIGDSYTIWIYALGLCITMSSRNFHLWRT